MPAQPLRPRRGAIDHNALHGAVAGSSPALPVPTPPATHAPTPPSVPPKNRAGTGKSARPTTRASISKAKAGAAAAGAIKAPTPATPAPSTPAAPAEPVVVPAPTPPAPNASLKRKHEQSEAPNSGTKPEEPANKRAKTDEPPPAVPPTVPTTASTAAAPIQPPVLTTPAAPVASQQPMPTVVTPQQLQLSTPINYSNYTTPESVLELVRSCGDGLQAELSSAPFDTPDGGNLAEALQLLDSIMFSPSKHPSSDGPSASTAPGSSAAPKDANNTSAITEDTYDIFEFFDYPSYAEDPLPELERSNLHSTVSPESNAAQDAMMKTPPSQLPKKPVTVAGPTDDAAQAASAGGDNFSDRLPLGEASYYQNTSYKFEGPMPSQEPWVITPA